MEGGGGASFAVVSHPRPHLIATVAVEQRGKEHVLLTYCLPCNYARETVVLHNINLGVFASVSSTGDYEPRSSSPSTRRRESCLLIHFQQRERLCSLSITQSPSPHLCLGFWKKSWKERKTRCWISLRKHYVEQKELHSAREAEQKV